MAVTSAAHPERGEVLARLAEARTWDLVVIGGGATGVGVALDAASRGYTVALLEQHDFGKGTSSRSTKLVHGGVRYLEQGNVPLVMGALRERGLLRRNAPHLVHELPFVVPSYDWWESPFYGIGLKVYNALAGRWGFGPSEILSRDEVLARLPTIRTDGLRGGVVYHDGQFDDARLLVNMVQTAAAHGAALANYVEVAALVVGADGFVDGVVARDVEGGREWTLRARVVVNATGAFADAVRRMAHADAEPMVAPSQGVHLVFDGSFLPGGSAIMVPHTSDGRVLFAIPWHDHTLVGTTDTAIDEPTLEPVAMPDEVAFILETAGQYLHRAPAAVDVRSVFAGIRPLVRAAGKGTAALSRDHTIHVDPSGLLTIAGGKWTTWRHMAEDVVDHASELGHLEPRACVTRELPIHGSTGAEPHDPASATFGGDLRVYGGDAPAIRDLQSRDPSLAAALHPALPYTGAEVVWAVRAEMARTVEDVLARRLRALFLDARAAIAMAPRVARLMAVELDRDDAWAVHEVARFAGVAAHYRLPGT